MEMQGLNPSASTNKRNDGLRIFLGAGVWTVLIFILVGIIVACIVVPTLTAVKANDIQNSIKRFERDVGEEPFFRHEDSIQVRGGSDGVTLDFGGGTIYAGDIALGHIGDLVQYLDHLTGRVNGLDRTVAYQGALIANLTIIVNGLVGGSPFAIVNGQIQPVGAASGLTLNLLAGDIRVATGLTFRQIQALLTPGSPTSPPSPTVAPVPTFAPAPTVGTPTVAPVPRCPLPFHFERAHVSIFPFSLSPIQSYLHIISPFHTYSGPCRRTYRSSCPCSNIIPKVLSFSPIPWTIHYLCHRFVPLSLLPSSFTPTSASPVSGPSVSPTSGPPTLSPTEAPSSFPTYEPTSGPTLEPTLSPTLSPSLFPTLSPTLSPTLVPRSSGGE
jgi:hypothetical protein